MQPDSPRQRSEGVRRFAPAHRWIDWNDPGRHGGSQHRAAPHRPTEALWPRLKKTYAPFALGCAASKPLSEDIYKSVLPQGNHLVDMRRDTFALINDAGGRLVTVFNGAGWRGMSQRSMQDLVEYRYN